MAVIFYINKQFFLSLSMQGYFIILQKTDRQQSELIYECPSQNLAESFNYIVETYSEII